MKIFLLVLLNFGVIFGQSQIVDFVEELKGQPDTTIVRELNKQIWANRSKNPDLALQFGEKALSISEAINDLSLSATSHNFIGVVYRNTGDYETSLYHYVTALNLAEKVNDSIQIAYSYNNIGGIYRLQSNFNLALENIFNALRIFEKLDFKSGMGFCTINIGVLYWQQKNYPKALDYLYYSLSIREGLGDEPGIAVTLNNIAEVYYEQKKFSEALRYYLELEKVYEKQDDPKGMAAVWSGIGGVYYFEGNYNKALEYREQALKIDQRIGNVTGVILNHNNLGLIYAQLNQYDLAEDHLKKASQLANSLSTLTPRLDCYKFYSDYYEIRSDYKNAFLHMKKYEDLTDSLQNIINTAQISEMESVYRTEKAEREKKFLQNELTLKENQQIYFVVIIILVLVLIVFLYHRYKIRKETNEQLQKINATKDKFFRIVAHDLKNPFNSLLGYSEFLVQNFEDLSDEEKKQNAEGLYDSSRRLYALLENLLEWSQTQFSNFTYEPEIINLAEIINKNISLFSQNAKIKNIELVSDFEEGLIAICDMNMIDTIIRNLLSNAIKFTKRDGIVEVTTKKTGNKIFVGVKDTGVGIDNQTQLNLFKLDKHSTKKGTDNEAGTGLGLILVKELSEKMGCEIEVESEEGKGSTFTLIIPVK